MIDAIDDASAKGDSIGRTATFAVRNCPKLLQKQLRALVADEEDLEPVSRLLQDHRIAPRGQALMDMLMATLSCRCYNTLPTSPLAPPEDSITTVTLFDHSSFFSHGVLVLLHIM